MRSLHWAWSTLAVVNAASATTEEASTAVYRNANFPTEDRVADLLRRMSIQDKAAQLIQGDLSNWINITSGAFNATGLDWNMRNRAGQFWVGRFVDWSALSAGIKTAQDYLLHNTTLGIPAFVQSEGIHGLVTANATIFNSPIAHACSWNPTLVQSAARAIAKEALALGINQLFAPLGDLARELRFGRVEETYGEDPFIAGEMAYSFVKGLQSGQVSAMVKHFAAFATPEQGLNTGPVHGGPRELFTTYLPPYKRAIIDAGAYSVMSAYHCYDGIPAVASRQMLTSMLRDQWGYKYWVTSDAGGTDRLCTAFNLCRARPLDSEAITRMVLSAGGDVEMGGGSYSFQQIPAMVAAGTLNETLIDTAVARVLRSKFDMGLFEHPYLGVPPAEHAQHIHTAEHVALARQLDAESIVLLENRHDVLPLHRSAHVAVLGPMAHGFVNYGDYVAPGAQARGITSLDGIRAAVGGSGGQATYAKGCERWSSSEEGFPEAVAVAAAADVAVVVVGSWSRDQAELWSGANATTGEHIDVSDLRLPGAMARLVSVVVGTGTPTVVVFSSGKPVTEAWISANASALVQQFYPSEQGGHALADVLFGEVNPSGKLAVGVPYDVGTTPSYYDYLNSGRGAGNPGRVYPDGRMQFGSNYALQSSLPLYEFGYGKSYSTFAYSRLRLSSLRATALETVTVSLEVTNNSTRDGAEVVQLYVRDEIASVVVPNKQLKGFAKVFIKAGETQAVSMDLKVADLGLWDVEMQYVVEPGEFSILVGSSSKDLRASATLTVV